MRVPLMLADPFLFVAFRNSRVASASRFDLSGAGFRFLLVAACLFVSSTVAMAQRKPSDNEKPKPRPIKVTTKDGIELAGVYVPSSKGREAIPIILVHEWDGQMSPYNRLVASLAEQGYAIVAFDYRGHGGSSDYVDNRGRPRKFEPSRMSSNDMKNIVRYDMETIKKFLIEENNEGNLNLNALVVVGVGEGGIIASHWTVQDWSFPNVGAIKQGKDVKALVLISPDKQFKGLSIDAALREKVFEELPLMLVGGEDAPDARDTNRMARKIAGDRRRAGAGEPRGFFFLPFPTNLSKAALVNQQPKLSEQIGTFIKTFVEASSSDHPWVERR